MAYSFFSRVHEKDCRGLQIGLQAVGLADAFFKAGDLKGATHYLNVAYAIFDEIAAKAGHDRRDPIEGPGELKRQV